MKKLVISAFVVLMSVSSFAQSASKVDTGKALQALMQAAPSVKMIGNVSPNVTLQQILSPLINDIMNGIATGVAMGDGSEDEKELASYSMACQEIGNSLAKCTIDMNSKTNIGTSIVFEVMSQQDGSMQLHGSSVIVENDL